MPAPRIFSPGDRSVAAPEFRPQARNRGPQFAITGITKDVAGVALPSCTVHLFRTETDAEVDAVTSDASSGAYSFPNVTPGDSHYVVAYLAGSPDVAGTTKNTLTGTDT